MVKIDWKNVKIMGIVALLALLLTGNPTVALILGGAGIGAGFFIK
jgi:hypothetical protein